MRLTRLLAFVLLLFTVPARADSVTEWTILADKLGQGAANWHTLAIMQMAMHDAWNAAMPTYRRWYPPTPDEPRVSNPLPQAAMAAAARRVLLSLHPKFAPDIERQFRQALGRTANGPQQQSGVALGNAIGVAAVRRRANDGYERGHLFVEQTGSGNWRPTPLYFDTSGSTETRPFLFASRADNPGLPPPPVGSERDRRDLAEVLRIGSADSDTRTQAETDAAMFWAFQSSQRGFVALAASLLEAHPRPGGLAAHARIMSQLASAMADSAILIWADKEQYYHWRPITAIRETVPGDARWEPLLETPPHPEYPSGHAADCFTAAAVLDAVFPDVRGPIVYWNQSGRPPQDSVGMGQHAQGSGGEDIRARHFPSFDAAAQECSESRIWAGAHFRAADEESHRLATIIAHQALAAVPPLP